MNREQKQQQIHGRIVDAVMTLYREKSLDEMTSDEIAYAAGVSKRTLYKYFSSKTEMYLAIVEQGFIQLMQAVDDAMVHADDQPLTQIRCIGRAYLAFYITHPHVSRLLVGFNHMDYITQYRETVLRIAQYADKYEITPLVRAHYQQHSAQHPVRAESVAIFLWAQIQGLAALIASKHSWMEEYYDMTIDEIIEENLMLVDVLMKGVCSEKEI